MPSTKWNEYNYWATLENSLEFFLKENIKETIESGSKGADQLMVH